MVIARLPGLVIDRPVPAVQLDTTPGVSLDPAGHPFRLCRD